MTTFEEQVQSFLYACDIERELGGGGTSPVFVATDKSPASTIPIRVNVVAGHDWFSAVCGR